MAAPEHSAPAVGAALAEPRVEPPETAAEQGTLFTRPEDTVPILGNAKRPLLRVSRRLIEPVLPGLEFEKEVRETQAVSPATRG